MGLFLAAVSRVFARFVFGAIVVLERLFVFGKTFRVVGMRNRKSWRQICVKKPGAFELIEPGQIVNRVEPEMFQKGLRRSVCDRPTPAHGGVRAF